MKKIFAISSVAAVCALSVAICKKAKKKKTAATDSKKQSYPCKSFHSHSK